MHFEFNRQERNSIIKPLKKAIYQYGLIEDGDKIAVGLSGGKDSSTLFYLLTALQKKLPVKYEIVPICLDLGFQGVDLSPLQQFVEKLDNKLHIESTEISKVVFEVKKEKSPCSLCANMRRGALYSLAKEMGCNKVALGHHLDDGIETFLMNILYGGKLGTFQPKTYLDRTDITLIRPMIAIEEELIKRFVETHQIPVIHNPCPADKHTSREDMKKLLEQFSATIPDIRQKFLHGFKTIDLRDFWREDLV